MSELAVCALEHSGRVQCWGATADFQVLPPGPVPGLLPFARDVACGLQHCCALVGDNGVSCWGLNAWNQLGREGGPRAVPVSVPMPGRVEQLSAAGRTTCALLRDGEVWCWGFNLDSQLGLPALLQSSEPVWVTQ